MLVKLEIHGCARDTALNSTIAVISRRVADHQAPGLAHLVTTYDKLLVNYIN